MTTHTRIGWWHTTHCRASCRGVAILTRDLHITSMLLVTERDRLFWFIADIIDCVARGIKPPSGCIVRSNSQKQKPNDKKKKPNATQQQPPEQGSESSNSNAFLTIVVKIKTNNICLSLQLSQKFRAPLANVRICLA